MSIINRRPGSMRGTHASQQKIAEILTEESLDRLKSAKTIIREVEKKAQQNVPIVHKERRKYLRALAAEALLILEDEPGLLAPQALLVFELLT